jgi:hypothetical protein
MCDASHTTSVQAWFKLIATIGNAGPSNMRHSGSLKLDEPIEIPEFKGIKGF